MADILLIEPDHMLRRIYEQALRTDGYTVIAAHGAQQALDSITDRAPPRVVIMEIQMTEYSGIAFLHEFRSYSEWLRVPVVIHTRLHPQRFMAVAEALGRDLGVERVLYKPETRLDRLLSTVREIVG